jgi:hypothetical protein
MLKFDDIHIRKKVEAFVFSSKLSFGSTVIGLQDIVK